MAERILICGGNGAGKSTLGRELAQRLGCPFLDIEDYYFPGRKPDGAYKQAKTREEVSRALTADLRKYETCVLASVKGDYGEEAEALLTRAVLLEAPKGLRMERVRKRSYEKFGNRMRPGGDLFEKEEGFFALVDTRPESLTEDWLIKTSLPVLRLDAALPVEENVRKILKHIRKP